MSALVLVLSQLGLFNYQFGFWQLIFTMALIASLISSLRYLMMPGAVFALAFLAIIYAQPLGITKLVPWTILGAAVLLSMGLSMLIHPRTKTWGHQNHWHHGKSHHDTTGDIDNDHVALDLTFGNSIHYIHSKNFQLADINVSMAGAKLYFDDVAVAPNGATIHVDVSLGSLELYLPAAWQLHFHVENSMGHLSEDGTSQAVGPAVELTGNVALGELTIHYLWYLACAKRGKAAPADLWCTLQSLLFEDAKEAVTKVTASFLVITLIKHFQPLKS